MIFIDLSEFEYMHQGLHAMQEQLREDPEREFLCSISRREMALLALGIAMAAQIYPCLVEQYSVLEDKLCEITDAQRDRVFGEDDGEE